MRDTTKITNKKTDWNVTVFVEPALWGIEQTSLMTFEYKGNKIVFIENKGNQNIAIHYDFEKEEYKKQINETKLSIQLKSDEQNLLTEIDTLMSHFLGRFELDGARIYHYRLGSAKNLKNGSRSAYGTINISKPIDTEDENYIVKIDRFAESSDKDVLANSIRALHYAKTAISPNHAYLSIANALYYLINDIGRQYRTNISGAVAVVILFYEKIIKDEKERTKWGENLKWVHETIDQIRYYNKKVDENDKEKIMNMYKEFLDMYIRYNQQRVYGEL